MVGAVQSRGQAVGAGAHDVFPDRPITLVVTFPPGGGTDTLARRLGQRLESVLGQPVIVENRAGASGNIGANWVARARPDGYTLLVVNSSYAINPGVFRELGFDPVHDLRGVINVAYVPSVLVTKPNAHWSDLGNALEDRGDLERPAPSFASCGNGTPQHLAGEMLMERAQAAWLHVPYKGCGPALAAVTAGNVDFAIITASSAIPLINAGTLRPLAVTSPARSTLLPRVPTVAEAGYPGYALDQWHGLLAPAATPDAVIERLNQAVADVMRDPGMVAGLRAVGYATTTTSAAAFQEIIEGDITRFAALTKKMGLRVD
ncbi:tripartite tricarboxylate transporter substrate binding protein [Paracandidimonas lactea]|uniref:tripartite tricarboxylate transporter substrate binding protein n=1 Tax=Paracandidimonas lactea TaxID=2895524 RepID=UPI001F17B5A5|nr:tripartite tricarboxylate transporter substrate binding protein [Paracandidimonas lactea]